MTSDDSTIRQDGRGADAMRSLRFQRQFTRSAPGSVLVEAGATVVLCTASVSDAVPAWLAGRGRGWLTAEYAMLPGSTSPRKPRERGPVADGRTTEIQRLIGRSLRAVTRLERLGERTLTLDCDVLQADGGTRTASICGALVACVDALHTIGIDPASALVDSVAATSVGIVHGLPMVDLNYLEDSTAAVDMNIVMTGAGRYVEIQGTGESDTFSDRQLAVII
jgi:ribonuclease PH